ncbi:MAG: hypothetical protein QNK37_01465 [Acidobacteriota bacterium]|nr:hypothetical protein [Acidobacteriota bacterium]
MKIVKIGLFLVLSVAVILWQARADYFKTSSQLLGELIGVGEMELAVMSDKEARAGKMAAFQADYEAFQKALDRERRDKTLEPFDYYERAYRGAEARVTALQHVNRHAEAVTTLERLREKVAGSVFEADALIALADAYEKHPSDEQFTEARRSALRIETLEAAVQHPEFMTHPNRVKRALDATAYVELAQTLVDTGDKTRAVTVYRKYFRSCIDQGLITRSLLAEWSRYTRLAEDLGVEHETMGRELSAIGMEPADKGSLLGSGSPGNRALSMDEFRRHNTYILISRRSEAAL